MTDDVQFFEPRPGARIAYRKTEGTSKTLPAVMFMGGFRSDMTGTKAAYLEERCRARGQTFVRYDYSGHGQSGTDFMDCTVSTWLADSEAVIDTLLTGPVIVVGSSLGGWLALLLAQRRPQRVAGLVLLAPAPDFPEDIWNLEFGTEERRHVETTGVFYRPSSYGDPYPLTRALFQDAKNHLLLDKRSVYPCAIHILHGKADPDVPWQKSERIMEQSMAPSIRVTWIDDGDHRLSRDQDLKLLDDTVVEMLRLPRIEAAK